MGNVHLYLFDQYEALPDSFVDDHLHLLPPSRQEQCARYRQPIDQANCVLAYLLLAQGLREQYDIAEPSDFAHGDNGKPYLKEYPHISFNISHCKHGVVCAIADFEVGVDIQDIRPYDPAMARRVCTAEELRQLAASDDPARFFYKLWIAKESYAKMLGCSIADVLKQDVPFEGVFSMESNLYCLALRCNRESFIVRMGDSNMSNSKQKHPFTQADEIAQDEKRQPDNVFFYTTGGTTFEIEEYFDGTQTYNDIVRNAIRREFED